MATSASAQLIRLGLSAGPSPPSSPSPERNSASRASTRAASTAAPWSAGRRADSRQLPSSSWEKLTVRTSSGGALPVSSAAWPLSPPANT